MALMGEIGPLMERGEFGGLAWVNEVTGYGDRVCIALYPQSRQAGAHTEQLAVTLGLVDINRDPTAVADVTATVTATAATLTGPGWSVLLAEARTKDDARLAAAAQAGTGLLIVGHGKGWAQWAETDESLVAFLDRERRARASHGWITLKAGVVQGE